MEQRWIQEIDINPLLASPEQLVALDARVVLFGPEVTEEQLPRLPITPYPSEYVQPWTTKKGEPLIIRPIRPEDEPLMVKFHESLSERSVYLRYLNRLVLDQRVAHERLARICFIDYDREMALVAVHKDPQTGEKEIVAASRLMKIPGGHDARFSILVSDSWQGHGLGAELISRLLNIARDQKLARVLARMSADNQVMHKLCERLGFQFEPTREEGIIQAQIRL